MSERADLDDALPLTVPVYQILLTLSDRALHGYAMIQDISARTEGEVQLTASTLYAALKRLLDDGWIEEVEGSPEFPDEDSRRRTYRITEPGLTVLRLEARRLERAARMARDKELLADATEGGH